MRKTAISASMFLMFQHQRQNIMLDEQKSHQSVIHIIKPLATFSTKEIWVNLFSYVQGFSILKKYLYSKISKKCHSKIENINRRRRNNRPPCEPASLNKIR